MKIAIEAQRIFRPDKHGMDFVALETIRELQKRNDGNEYYIIVAPGKDHCLEESANLSIVEVAPGHGVEHQVVVQAHRLSRLGTPVGRYQGPDQFFPRGLPVGPCQPADIVPHNPAGLLPAGGETAIGVFERHEQIPAPVIAVDEPGQLQHGFPLVPFHLLDGRFSFSPAPGPARPGAVHEYVPLLHHPA